MHNLLASRATAGPCFRVERWLINSTHRFFPSLVDTSPLLCVLPLCPYWLEYLLRYDDPEIRTSIFSAIERVFNTVLKVLESPVDDDGEDEDDDEGEDEEALKRRNGGGEDVEPANQTLLERFVDRCTHMLCRLLRNIAQNAVEYQHERSALGILKLSCTLLPDLRHVRTILIMMCEATVEANGGRLLSSPLPVAALAGARTPSPRPITVTTKSRLVVEASGTAGGVSSSSSSSSSLSSHATVLAPKAKRPGPSHRSTLSQSASASTTGSPIRLGLRPNNAVVGMDDAPGTLPGAKAPSSLSARRSAGVTPLMLAIRSNDICPSPRLADLSPMIPLSPKPNVIGGGVFANNVEAMCVDEISTAVRPLQPADVPTISQDPLRGGQRAMEDQQEHVPEEIGRLVERFKSAADDGNSSRVDDSASVTSATSISSVNSDSRANTASPTAGNGDVAGGADDDDGDADSDGDGADDRHREDQLTDQRQGSENDSADGNNEQDDDDWDDWDDWDDESDDDGTGNSSKLAALFGPFLTFLSDSFTVDRKGTTVDVRAVSKQWGPVVFPRTIRRGCFLDEVATLSSAQQQVIAWIMVQSKSD